MTQAKKSASKKSTISPSASSVSTAKIEEIQKKILKASLSAKPALTSSEALTISLRERYGKSSGVTGCQRLDLNSNDASVRLYAIKDGVAKGKLSSDQLEKALIDDHSLCRFEALKYPDLNLKQYLRAISDGDKSVSREAVRRYLDFLIAHNVEQMLKERNNPHPHQTHQHEAHTHHEHYTIPVDAPGSSHINIHSMTHTCTHTKRQAGLTQDQLERALTDHSASVRWLAASQSFLLSRHQIARCLGDHDARVRLACVRTGLLDHAQQRHLLMYEPVDAVKIAVVQAYELPADLAILAIRDRSSAVKIAAIEQFASSGGSTLSEYQLKNYLQDPDPAVVEAVVRVGTLTKEEIQEMLIHEKNPKIRIAIIEQYPLFMIPHLVDIVLSDRCEAVRHAAVKRFAPRMTVGQQDRALTDESEAIRMLAVELIGDPCPVMFG